LKEKKMPLPTVTFDPRECKPWAPIDGILGRMKSLTVSVGGETIKGDVTLSLSDAGHAVLNFAGPKKRVVKK
jgi:hypothetical protein